MTLSFVIIVMIVIDLDARKFGSIGNNAYLCGSKLKATTMNSKTLRLDAPYNIIYAGGRIGRHIATMTVWEDNDMGIFDAQQYAMIDEGGELAAGALVVEAELSDCRVICNERDPRVRLRWLAEITKYDLEQEEPVEFRYLWDRLSLLGVKVIWDKAKDEKGKWLKDEDGELIDENVYEVSISFEGTHKHLYASSYTMSGFYFVARGKVEDVYNELHYQHMAYESAFDNDNLLIKFTTHDGWEQHIIDLLNERKESYTPAADEDQLY